MGFLKINDNNSNLICKVNLEQLVSIRRAETAQGYADKWNTLVKLTNGDCIKINMNATTSEDLLLEIDKIAAGTDEDYEIKCNDYNYIEIV